jgi:hypothetical protein
VQQKDPKRFESENKIKTQHKTHFGSLTIFLSRKREAKVGKRRLYVHLQYN